MDYTQSADHLVMLQHDPGNLVFREAGEFDVGPLGGCLVKWVTIQDEDSLVLHDST